MKNLEHDNLAELIQSETRLLVLFGSSEFVEHRLLKPKIWTMSHENPKIVFISVNVVNFPKSSLLATVAENPTVAAFKNGALIGLRHGNSRDGVQELIEILTA